MAVGEVAAVGVVAVVVDADTDRFGYIGGTGSNRSFPSFFAKDPPRCLT